MRSTRTPQRTPVARALVALVVVATGLSGFAGTAGGPRKLAGYRVVKVRTIATGLTSYLLEGGSPRQRIWVAVATAEAKVRPVARLSRNRVAGPSPRMQTTSSMCRADDCLLAVNGDFYGSAGWPRGALVRGREPMVSQSYNRPHLLIARDGGLSFGRPDLRSRLVIRYPPPLSSTQPPLVPDLEEVLGQEEAPAKPRDERVKRSVSGVNVRRGKNNIVLYTQRFGKRTATSKSGVDLVLKIVEPSGRIKIGQKTILKPARLDKDGNAKIPTRGAVLSARGNGADKLRTIWKDVRSGKARKKVALRFRTDRDLAHAIGGRPVLVRDGKNVAPSDDYFSRVRAPRTVAGWNAKGDLFLVTIDGRRSSAAGMNLVQAARLMRALGVHDAINLDGGGSTTFVIKGEVRNRPSSGYERSVSTSLVLVKA